MSSASTLLVTLALTLTIILAAVAGDDVTCLREFKSTISDPTSMLSSWSFSSPGLDGYICTFTGVYCWNGEENRVASLSLPSSSLGGQIPSSLSLCSSINNLDLSHNSFSGPLPSSLCTWLPYLVYLDLSFNSFSGPIPSNLSDCKFLNSLVLSNNQLSGPIPPALGALSRLRILDLSSNQLTGQIPSDLSSKFNSSSFSNNNIEYIHDDSDDMFDLYLSMGIGYGVGLWVIIGVFIFVDKWRIAYFRFLDNIADKIWLMKEIVKKRFLWMVEG